MATKKQKRNERRDEFFKDDEDTIKDKKKGFIDKNYDKELWEEQKKKWFAFLITIICIWIMYWGATR